MKLIFSEGEIDFVVSAPLTKHPTAVEMLFGREVHVETSAEIVAKKVWHRGVGFTPSRTTLRETESGARFL